MIEDNVCCAYCGLPQASLEAAHEHVEANHPQVILLGLAVAQEHGPSLQVWPAQVGFGVRLGMYQIGEN